jgi:SPP1 gp7 family putative phage head morphogenesis protein
MGTGPVDIGVARAWLQAQGIGGTLGHALAGVLARLWAEGWNLGAEGAEEVSGSASNITPQALADLLSRYSAEWTNSIAASWLDRIAAVLAAGGTAAQLELALKATLASKDDAERIAITELIRAMAAAAYEVYRQAGIERVIWVTAEDASVCAECEANASAGPHWLGDPFPSGAISPPEHPRCRCALLPYMEE